MNNVELRGAASLAAVYVLRMLGLFTVIPVLAILTLEYPDYSPLLVGLAIGGYGLTQALMQIPMGMLSDRIGRKTVIVAGLVLFSLGSFVAAQSDSLVGVVIGRILQGAGAIAGAIMALAGDISRENQRSKVMAIIGIAIGFSFYLSLLIGPLLAENFGLSGLFSITGALALCCIPLVLFVVPNASNLAPSGDTLPRIADLKPLLSDAKLSRLNISVFILHLFITLIFMQIPKALVQLGWPVADHWQLYLPVLVLSILIMAGIMRLGRNKDQVPALMLAVLLMAVCFSGMLVFSQQWLILVTLVVLFFAGFNYLEASLPAMVSSLAPAGKKGSAMGCYASFQFLGAFAGGLLSGYIYQYFDPLWLNVIALAICLLWMFWIRNIAAGEKHLKRYTLALNSASSLEQSIQELRKLAGVKDLTWVKDEMAVYLKVDSRDFNLQLARQIVGTC